MSGLRLKSVGLLRYFAGISKSSLGMLACMLVLTLLTSCARICKTPTPEPVKESVDVLEKRYRAIWDSVKKEGGEAEAVPELVAHLGPISGDNAVIWVRINDETVSKDTANWSLDCSGRNVNINQKVIDKDYSTARLEVPLDKINQNGEECTVKLEKDEKTIYTSAVRFPPASNYSNSEGRFSFAAFSCNEPFNSKYGGMLARDIAMWKRLEMRTRGEKSETRINDEIRPALPERPSFVLGLGDQIYVDPDWDEKNPLALFSGDKANKRNYRFEEREDFRTLLDTVYKYNFSMPALANALNGIPSYMMWDDHEIRDGWGSHSDEYKGVWPLYFREARHAFIANQYMRMPAKVASQEEYDNLINSDESLHFVKPNIKEDVHFLMLDGRSKRSKGGLYDEEAQKFVEKWLESGKKKEPDLFILTVGVPLFLSRHHEDGILPGVSSEICPDMVDDINDSWGSCKNISARNEFLARLATHFTDNPEDRLLVLSGDVHQSALFFIKLKDRFIGHEVVTSGISYAVDNVGKTVTTQTDIAKNIDPFKVYAAGKISRAISFAEVVVDRGYKGDFDLSVVFHTNHAYSGGLYGWLGDNVLANSDLLKDTNLEGNKKAYYYYPYQFDYEKANAHLDEALDTNQIGAGTIVPLRYEKPKVNSIRSVLSERVFSALQQQGAFCSVPDALYDKTLAESWDLTELEGRCIKMHKVNKEK